MLKYYVYVSIIYLFLLHKYCFNIDLHTIIVKCKHVELKFSNLRRIRRTCASATPASLYRNETLILRFKQS